MDNKTKLKTMTQEEKQVLKKLIANQELFKEEVGLTKEISDEAFAAEVKQGISLLSFGIELVAGAHTPDFIKKRVKSLWYRIKKAIAEWLRDIACEVDPDCN